MQRSRLACLTNSNCCSRKVVATIDILMFRLKVHCCPKLMELQIPEVLFGTPLALKAML